MMAEDGERKGDLDLFELRICSFEIHRHIRNALQEQGIERLGDLLSMTADELSCLDGISAGDVEEVRGSLSVFGTALKGERGKAASDAEQAGGERVRVGGTDMDARRAEVDAFDEDLAIWCRHRMDERLKDAERELGRIGEALVRFVKLQAPGLELAVQVESELADARMALGRTCAQLADVVCEANGKGRG